MDEPIIYPHDCSPNEDPFDLGDELCNAIELDDVDEFLLAVRHPDFNHYREVLQYWSIFHADAVRIATAVFEGETKGFYDVKDLLFKDGITPIHHAAGFGAVKVTNYLIQRGDSVDVHCDVPIFNLKQASPIDLALESIESILFSGWESREEDDDKFWTPRMSIIELLVSVCSQNRHALEVVRLLVQSTQNKERVRQAFIDYADKGKLVHLAALFLAAPDLFMPYPFVTLQDRLSSLEERTNIEEGTSLLLDVFATAGDKLVAYVRVEDPIVLQISVEQEAQIIAFLLREVTYRKQGVSSRDDYFLRFFMPVDRLSSPHTPKLHHNINLPNNRIMRFRITSKDINIDSINREFSCLKLENAGEVERAIGDKLSSMSRLRGLFREIDIKSKEREKYLPEWFPTSYGRNFERVLESFHSKAASTRPKADSKLTLAKSLENKVMLMQPNKLKSLFWLLKLNKLPMVFKRFIRG